MLTEKSFLVSYTKTKNNAYEEFYKPCFENSIKYDRLTGYFGSSIFVVINSALNKFVLNNKGKIRIVCSPILNDKDIEAIVKGYQEKNDHTFSDGLNSILDDLFEKRPNCTRLLSSLISSGVLEIKLAVFGNDYKESRLVHDKAGIFKDKLNNTVAFRGSNNETYSGIHAYGNSESFDVFTSWQSERDNERIKMIEEQFENIWNNEEKNMRVYDLPKLTIEKIKKIKSNVDPSEFDSLIDSSEIELGIQKPKWFAEEGENARIIKKHQELILENWEKNERRGIFQMCTGSGKTFTALCAIRDSIYNKNEVPLIIAPSVLLFEQWKKELIKIFKGDIAILEIGAGTKLDVYALEKYTKKNLESKRCILTLYQSASKEKFIKNFRWGEHIFMICDEVHTIGSGNNQRLLEVKVGPRIGLSATPERYFDNESTNKIFEFFHGIIEPKYDIKEAIKDKVLVEYYYYFSEVKLTREEQEEWTNLSIKINKKIAVNSKNNEIKNDGYLDNLLFKRADILKKAHNKIYEAEKILLENYEDGQRWLVYLDDQEHVKTLYDVLINHKKFNNEIYEYHSNIENQKDTIKYFVNHGGIILAINCLDEGVDIPAIERAIILSSSKNPRQYIQRRGRVLRRSKNKNFAYVYDCLVLPDLSIDKDNESKILRGEIIRSKNFAADAKNSTTSIRQLKILMNNYKIEDIEGEFGIE